ncbi:MAG: SusC/RagA family TonB-linked outer membrane protein [Bacteroidales bacterium]|nr:SusC/RagA family TonB-linked outer membrane protein [Bacteroidales bacterium]
MKNFLTCLFFFFLYIGGYAQSKMVNGVVVSADDGQPIIGASVTVVGEAAMGTVTDIDGKFKLTVPQNRNSLLVSYIGMKQQQIAVGTNLRIELKSDDQQLDEIVVTGMQRVDKRLFTGAASKLNADDAALSGVADVSRRLEGRAAGVSVQNVSGTFGTAPKIRVRGATSIYGNSKPLWVVDGVVMEDALDISSDDLSSGNAETLIASSIAGLNADDIESFQILKDGSATSIYGARAMAGVIVVTTKKGKAGTSRFSYSTELTMRLKPSYANFNIMNSQEQMGIYKEMEEKGWLEFTSLANASSSGVYGKMYRLIDDYQGNGSFGLENTPEARNAYLRQAEFRNTDWFDLLFNNSIMQNHAISISSGTEKARFYGSLSIMRDPGWSLSSGVNRYTANANASYDIFKNLTLNILSSGSYRKQKAPGTLSQEVDVVSGEVKRDFDINPYSFALNTSRTLDPDEYYRRNYADFNIFHELQNNYIDLNVSDVKFQAELNWKILKGLEANFLSAIKYQTSTQEHHVKDRSNQAEAYRAGILPEEDATIREANPLLYTDPDVDGALPETILPEGGIYTFTNHSMKGVDLRATMSYNTSVNDMHIVNLFGGAESSAIDRNKVWFRGWGYQYDNGGIPFYDYTVFKQGKEENSDYYGNSWTYARNLAFFSSMTYSYAGRYTVNLTGRYEGSNKLGKSRSARWLPTWNISGAWNAHEELWFDDLLGNVLSNATFKASYSLTADRGPAFVTNSEVVILSYNPWRPTADITESGLYIDGLENSELTYEKKNELNVGADFGFLKNRINVTADVYFRQNFDLIGLIYTQGVGGEIAKYANVASMNSNGVELSIATKNIDNKKFKWSTDFIFASAKNVITDLDSRSNVITLISGEGYARQGYPVRSLFSIPFAGLNEEGIPTFVNQDNETTVTNLDFQEYENLDFLKYEGPTDPTITGSLGNTFSWNSFTLNVFITYSLGNVVRLDPIFKSSYSDLTSMPKEFKNRWVIPGDEEVTNIPVIASLRQDRNYDPLSYAYNAYNYSTERIAKGDFVRMKEISLSYSFPKKLIDNLKIANLSMKLQATNLFLLYADKKLNGQDPEFFNSGGVATPMPKQLTFTINMGI